MGIKILPITAAMDNKGETLRVEEALEFIDNSQDGGNKIGISEILVMEVMHGSNGYLAKFRVEGRLSSQVEGLGCG